MLRNAKPSLTVLALDQATTTGWAVGKASDLDTHTIEFGLFRMPKRAEVGERLEFFRNELIERVTYYKVDLIAYETPYWPRPASESAIARHKAAALDAGEEYEGPPAISSETLQFLQWVRGVLMGTAAALAVPTENYASSTWRKTALGFGRAPKIDPATGKKPDAKFFKRAMIKRARALGYSVDSDNDADAIGILLHALTGAPAAARAQGDLLEFAGVLK